MGNVSFFPQPTDTSPDPGTEAAVSSTDAPRQTSFYSGEVAEGIGIGSLIKQLIEAVQRAEDAADRAEAAQAAAEAAQVAAESAWAEFASWYLGAYAEPPTTDPLGNPVQVGALYYDTTEELIYVWTGSVWQVFATQIGPMGKIGPAGLPGL